MKWVSHVTLTGTIAYAITADPMCTAAAALMGIPARTPASTHPATFLYLMVEPPFKQNHPVHYIIIQTANKTT